MQIPEDLDLRAPEHELTFMVTRFLVRSAVTWFSAMFIFGGFAGWSVSQWPVTRVGAIVGLAMSIMMAIFVGAVFYYSNGTMVTPRRQAKPRAP
jgi:hypothetical protein